MWFKIDHKYKTISKAAIPPKTLIVNSQLIECAISKAYLGSSNNDQRDYSKY